MANNYKKELHAPSIFTQGKLVKVMIQEIEENDSLREAATQRRLNSLLESIAQLTNDIEEIFLQRSEEVNYNKTVSKGLRENAIKIYSNF